jgi:transposase
MGPRQSHIEKEQVMEESTAYVGLDVHKDSIVVGLALGGAEPVEVGRIVNDASAVRRLVERLARRHGRLAFAYEAGPCGYELYRQLLSLGQSCLVVAPSLMPRRPGDRIKTDGRDARTLARLLRSGDLTAVWVPDAHHEAVRELVRCREDFKQVERRCRQQLCALLLRHGRCYDKSNWTGLHRKWLQGQRFDSTETQIVFDHYFQSIIEAEERIGRLERQMEDALPSWSLRGLVGGLMAMRGIQLVTAMTHAAELGDLTRFERAEALMAFVGVVPSEHSSGQSRRQGGITKSGNRHVRRVLIESSWSYRHKPGVNASLRARSGQASAAVQAIAWKAQKRLYTRYHRLITRGKSAQTAITAVAREQLGFIWAIGQKVMEEQRTPAPAGA